MQKWALRCICPGQLYDGIECLGQVRKPHKVHVTSRTQSSAIYVQSGSLLYLVLAGSNIGYGLPSVANDITGNQYFKVFYNMFSFFKN